MYQRLILLVTIVFVLMSVVFVSAVADTWPLPTKEKYYSPNKKFYLEVIPKKLGSQLEYFEDKVKGQENAGAAKGVKDNHAKAAFYSRKADGGYSKKVEFPLLNEVSPVSAIVADNGEYVVTFDNWHSMGYGDDVIVIYRSDGVLIRKFGLEDLLTEGDIETFSRSVSSRNWGGQHYIEEANGLLVLSVVYNNRGSREAGPGVHGLRIELATGRPLEEKRDLFPQLRVFSGVDTGITSETTSTPPGKPVCSSPDESLDSTEAVRIKSEEFYSKAMERPLPPIPPMAKTAHIVGTVVVEVLVSKKGDVICARYLSGNPYLRMAAVSACLKWKFKPFEVSGNAVIAVGTVTMNFKLTGYPVSPGK